MSPVRLNGSTSGYSELAAHAVAGNNSIALPTGNGTAYQVVRNGASAGSLEFADKIVSGTAQASTSGTSIDFTGIPSWVKRVTVMLNGVSTNGNNNLQCQVGSGSITSTGYVGGCGQAGASPSQTTASTGLLISMSNTAALAHTGTLQFTLLTGTTWVGVSTTSRSDGYGQLGGTTIALSGTLDRLRIIGSTTGSPTDTFDAGSINILYE